VETNRRPEEGVGLVEFALVFPIFISVLLVSMQFALIMMQGYSARHVVRENARWLAINPDTTDSALLTRVRANVMPVMDPNGVISVTTTPACAALSSGRCSGRAPGDVITVSLVYDTTQAIFLPTSFGFDGLRATFPTRLPAYAVSVLVE
jgi:Flp pilus assembly protein TadG